MASSAGSVPLDVDGSSASIVAQPCTKNAKFQIQKLVSKMNNEAEQLELDGKLVYIDYQTKRFWIEEKRLNF